ncbi:MAG: insulinase family protein [Bacteroidetes bacterium]|nr:insulinase family protein [Bacteroidota bacterium]
MRKLSFLLYICIFALLISCTNEKYVTKTKKDENGYTYEMVTNDPLKARIYTLDNGLKVYLSVNNDAPRIHTLIGVRAGATYDPAETTGLAHYLEHMMFKGTDEFGTIDWAKESALLAQISDLFEEHRNTSDVNEKKVIYHNIDSISGLAAKFAVANEYDRMTSAIGAKSTNAFTGDELTAYMNDVPSNQFEKWLIMEKERFSDLVLRIFHTELETVYEEFNMSQDNDWRKAHKALNSGLFKKHPYGTQTVLGKGEHLKNPSMVNIHNYFNTYYVPNNMAFCLSGDLDFEKTIKIIDKHWGEFAYNPNLPERNLPVEDPITEILEKEVVGPDAESVTMAYRFDGANSNEEKFVTLIDYILNNSKAGLIDLDLVQEQKVISASSSTEFLIDYGKHILTGRPREGQTLEEVKELLVAEIEKIKNADFEDWLPEAVINELNLLQIKGNEQNIDVAFNFLDAFIKKVNWKDQVAFNDELAKITKEEIVAFANEHYNENYVVVYKRNGKDDVSMKIEKPGITPVELNRDEQSKFYKDYLAMESETLKPVFVDYDSKIEKLSMPSGIEFSYINNPNNDLFKLYYILEMGKNHMKELPISVNYLPFLGTDKYSASELQKEFFKLGLSMDVYAGNDRSYVYISGLKKSFKEGVELLEHLLSNVKSDEQAYADYVDGILKSRANKKLNKDQILWSGMRFYGMFGEKSPFTDILTAEELKEIQPEQLTGLLKDLFKYKHQIFYYGPEDMTSAQRIIEASHQTPAELLDYPEITDYKHLDVANDKVYFVNYDMVQANFIVLAKCNQFDKSVLTNTKLFNEYFSSIVFQDIREARGLAYAAFAAYRNPQKTGKNDYMFSFVATQVDKFKTASDALNDLILNLPQTEDQFNTAKEAIMTKIETERITRDNVFWTNLANMDRGINYDYRKDVYDQVQNASLSEFTQFFNDNISSRNFTYLVLADREMIDMKALKELGEVKELTLEDIFGY